MKWLASVVLSLTLMSAAMAEERGADGARGAARDLLGSLGAAAVALNGYVAGRRFRIHGVRTTQCAAPRAHIASSRDAGVRTSKDHPTPTQTVPRHQAVPQAAGEALPSASNTASVAPTVNHWSE